MPSRSLWCHCNVPSFLLALISNVTKSKTFLLKKKSLYSHIYNSDECDRDADDNEDERRYMIDMKMVKRYLIQTNYLQKVFAMNIQYNRSISQIPQCTSPIYHNVPLGNRNVHCYKVVHCGIFVWCIVGFGGWIYWFIQYTWNMMYMFGFHKTEAKVTKLRPCDIIYIYIYIYIHTYASVKSCNDLSTIWHQAISWNNPGLLWNGSPVSAWLTSPSLWNIYSNSRSVIHCDVTFRKHWNEYIMMSILHYNILNIHKTSSQIQYKYDEISTRIHIQEYDWLLSQHFRLRETPEPSRLGRYTELFV